MKRASQRASSTQPFFVPPITLDRGSRVGLAEQVVSQIASMIEEGVLADRARLPSTRRLAGLLGVSRNTVLAIYDELAARDLVRGEPGRGVYVRADGRWIPLRRTKREAHFPDRAWWICDQDGNPLYLNY
jgi:DNA-binding FadR family transcriptional regulator